MTESASLSGFLLLRGPGVRVWCRPAARPWVEEALAAGRTLHEAARARREEHTLAGRAPVHVLPGGGGGSWAVRHYVRGGLFGPLLGDRYLRAGRPRPFQEARMSELVRSRGVETPVVVAAAVYVRGAFYRGDLVTEFREDAADLGALLFGDHIIRAGRRRSLLGRVGALSRQLAAAGVHHRDLNVKNVLVEDRGKELRLHVLDLDRVRVASAPLPRTAERMFRRLERSIRRWEERCGCRLESADWEALRDGFAGRSAPEDLAPFEAREVEG